MDVYGAHTAIKPGLAEKFRKKTVKNHILTVVLHSLVSACKNSPPVSKK
jgi:hypothetical protein